MPWKNGRAYDGDGYTPGPGKPQKQPVELLRRQWLATHPCGRLAFEYFVTGQEPTIEKAARRAVAEKPGEVTAGSITHICTKHKWGELRKLIRGRAQAAADEASLEAMKRVDEILREVEKEKALSKPGAPLDPAEKLKWMLELRDIWRKNAKEEKDGTKAGNWLKALAALDRDIEGLSRDDAYHGEAEDAVDYSDLHSAGVVIPELEALTPPEGLVIGPQAADWERQYREHQAALAETERG